MSKVTLTKGEWEVLGKNIWIDSKRCLVYFLGLKETPLEKHLYAVSYRKADYTRILTTRGFSYTVELNDVNFCGLSFSFSLLSYKLHIFSRIVQ